MYPVGIFIFFVPDYSHTSIGTLLTKAHRDFCCIFRRFNFSDFMKMSRQADWPLQVHK
ncbi:hypothetical Protein YC6258_01718 [Gynuella sunshinyii YC6258]|uniref:Uncharacterized protein n=1 Tax=Gynuella sunshinyii YC6258 TaxID=1445510 RepID=A0A0C5VHQ7_9GAMM|nr:hypothetical Protein YC6258_01718 [Gynuella sunshinyii YC6258]